MQKIEEMTIKLSNGGPCIYARGVFPDGTETGRIQFIGQEDEELKNELFASLKTGRDDCTAFVNMICGR